MWCGWINGDGELCVSQVLVSGIGGGEFFVFGVGLWLVLEGAADSELQDHRGLD